jgi:hypothetical protein
MSNDKRAEVLSNVEGPLKKNVNATVKVTVVAAEYEHKCREVNRLYLLSLRVAITAILHRIALCCWNMQ